MFSNLGATHPSLMVLFVVEEYYLLREVVKLLPFLTIENLKALQSRTKKTSNNGFKALYWFSFQLSIWSMVTE